jgi:glycosyltransferase involved in cell wall biosynthesis
MNIVYITRFFWPTMGAPATGTLELAKRLANRGHEVSLFVPDSSDPHIAKRPPPAFPKGLVVSYSRPRMSRLPAHTLSFVFLGFRAFRAACGAHVIFAQHHYGLHWASFCAAILSTITGKPLVIKAHDVFHRPTNTLESLLAILMKWVTWVSFRQAELVLVPGEELIDIVRRVYGLKAGKVRMSPNGVDTTKFGPSHRSDELRQMVGSKHMVVFCGGINLDSDASGLDVLVRATEFLRSEIPDLKVLVIGDGRDLPRLIQLANSLRLDGTVQFLGWVSPELIPMYLASADVAIGHLRATIETIGSTPLKVVEYMASGCVVVVGRGGCSEDLIVDGINGIVTESSAGEGLVKSMIKVLTDEKLAARLRSKAREIAERVYDWEVIVSELEETLRSAAELKNRRVFEYHETVLCRNHVVSR